MDNIEDLNLLDTQYADIIANSINPWYELEAIKKGLDPEDARVKTRLITLMTHKPETDEEWEELLDAWKQACGYRPDREQMDGFSKAFWGE